MINGLGDAGKEGIHCITVTGVDHGCLHRAVETARCGGKPTRISPGNDDP